VAYRFNRRQYRGEAFEQQKWRQCQFFGSGCEHASLKLLSFWEIAQPQKNQRCLILWRQLSIYPWRDWQAFYGQEISTVAGDAPCPWFSAELKAI